MTGTERFTSDTKDVDITGAMFVCNNGYSVFLCCFQQGVVLAIDRSGLMGDPFMLEMGIYFYGQHYSINNSKH